MTKSLKKNLSDVTECDNLIELDIKYQIKFRVRFKNNKIANGGLD